MVYIRYTVVYHRCMTVLDAFNEAIEKMNDASGRGGLTRLAVGTDCTVQQLSNLRARRANKPNESLPADICPAIERLTGVMCERLCPDADWSFIRGTGCNESDKPTAQTATAQ